MLCHMHGGQRTSLWSQGSVSTFLWVLGLEPRYQPGLPCRSHCPLRCHLPATLSYLKTKKNLPLTLTTLKIVSFVDNFFHMRMKTCF